MASQTLGVREFATLALFFIKFYLRHKENIDDTLPNGFIEALDTIVLNIDYLEDLNPPGPI